MRAPLASSSARLNLRELQQGLHGQPREARVSRGRSRWALITSSLALGRAAGGQRDPARAANRSRSAGSPPPRDRRTLRPARSPLLRAARSPRASAISARSARATSPEYRAHTHRSVGRPREDLLCALDVAGQHCRDADQQHGGRMPGAPPVDLRHRELGVYSHLLDALAAEQSTDQRSPRSSRRIFVSPERRAPSARRRRRGPGARGSRSRARRPPGSARAAADRRTRRASARRWQRGPSDRTASACASISAATWSRSPAATRTRLPRSACRCARTRRLPVGSARDRSGSRRASSDWSISRKRW